MEYDSDEHRPQNDNKDSHVFPVSSEAREEEEKEKVASVASSNANENTTTVVPATSVVDTAVSAITAVAQEEEEKKKEKKISTEEILSEKEIKQQPSSDQKKGEEVLCTKSSSAAAVLSSHQQEGMKRKLLGTQQEQRLLHSDEESHLTRSSKHQSAIAQIMENLSPPNPFTLGYENKSSKGKSQLSINERSNVASQRDASRRYLEEAAKTNNRKSKEEKGGKKKKHHHRHREDEGESAQGGCSSTSPPPGENDSMEEAETDETSGSEATDRYNALEQELIIEKHQSKKPRFWVSSSPVRHEEEGADEDNEQVILSKAAHEQKMRKNKEDRKQKQLDDEKKVSHHHHHHHYKLKVWEREEKEKEQQWQLEQEFARQVALQAQQHREKMQAKMQLNNQPYSSKKQKSKLTSSGNMIVSNYSKNTTSASSSSSSAVPIMTGSSWRKRRRENEGIYTFAKHQVPPHWIEAARPEGMRSTSPTSATSTSSGSKYRLHPQIRQFMATQGNRPLFIPEGDTMEQLFRSSNTSTGKHHHRQPPPSQLISSPFSHQDISSRTSSSLQFVEGEKGGQESSMKRTSAMNCNLIPRVVDSVDIPLDCQQHVVNAMQQSSPSSSAFMAKYHQDVLQKMNSGNQLEGETLLRSNLSPYSHEEQREVRTKRQMLMKEKLIEFFQVYNPDLLSQVDYLLEQFQGREKEMWDLLYVQYQQEAAMGQQEYSIQGSFPPPPSSSGSAGHPQGVDTKHVSFSTTAQQPSHQEEEIYSRCPGEDIPVGHSVHSSTFANSTTPPQCRQYHNGAMPDESPPPQQVFHGPPRQVEQWHRGTLHHDPISEQQGESPSMVLKTDLKNLHSAIQYLESEQARLTPSSSGNKKKIPEPFASPAMDANTTIRDEGVSVAANNLTLQDLSPISTSLVQKTDNPNTTDQRVDNNDDSRGVFFGEGKKQENADAEGVLKKYRANIAVLLHKSKIDKEFFFRQKRDVRRVLSQELCQQLGVLSDTAEGFLRRGTLQTPFCCDVDQNPQQTISQLFFR